MSNAVLGARKAYEAINGKKESFGVFHKTCFHLHTPESYDYKLLVEWDAERYKKATEQEILNICKERNVVLDAINLDDISLEGDYRIFKSKKELLAFCLLADAISSNGIEIVLVSDHNTIAGVDKLTFAIEIVRAFKSYGVYPEVFLGIEISCADRNHVIGIFDRKKVNVKQQIQEWLDEYLLTIEDGSFETSIEVLDFIKKMGGIGYIAHINSSDTFKDTFLSGAYKKKLLGAGLEFVGLTDMQQADYIQGKISNFRKSGAPIKFILDNDAHDIDSITDKLFWIKGSKRTYAMLVEALNDYEMSVSFSNYTGATQYIKGIYIERAENGFLTGKKNDSFCLKFSNALNCLIGGRGTGKSSVLEVLEYSLSQRCISNSRLEFICSHGDTWVLYEYQGTEYMIEVRMPHKEYPDDNILQRFGMNRGNSYRYRYFFDQGKVAEYALRNYVRVLKVEQTEDGIVFETVTDKPYILKKFFDVRYSVNDLVNTASGEEINRFIYYMMFSNRTLSKPEEGIRCRKKSGLLKVINDTQAVLVKRKIEVEAVISSFNSSQKGILQIEYTQSGVCHAPDFAKWLFDDSYKEGDFYLNYNIRQEDVVAYLLDLSDKIGVFEFLKHLFSDGGKSLRNLASLSEFCTPMTPGMVNRGISSLNEEAEIKILKNITDLLLNDRNIPNIINYLKEYVAEIERFSLKFNINNIEGTVQKEIYHDVSELSLGQKVVAMLNFILGYSEYSGDYRPLIIDQPEDNLDNRYIYKNLVKQLKTAKEKRQIIIATHNATIVTNAKADQVCVMASDNEHGWVEVTGYPSETRIKKRIINHLEGGLESFIHKVLTYRDAFTETELNKIRNYYL